MPEQRGNVLDAIRENGLDADIIYACGPTPMLRAIKEYAAEQNIECWIPWKSAWHAVSEPVLPVSASQKRWTDIPMCTIRESAKMDRYF